jgi:hypothetical protein
VRPLAWIVLFGFCLAVSLAEDQVKVSFSTLSGERFENVTVKPYDPLEISVFTSTGVKHVRFAELSPDLQKQFGYDAEKAAMYRKAIDAYNAQRAVAEAAEKRQAARSAAAEQKELDDFKSELALRLARGEQPVYDPMTHQLYSSDSEAARARTDALKFIRSQRP